MANAMPDGTHSAYPRRDGQPGWVGLGGWLRTETVAHPNINGLADSAVFIYLAPPPRARFFLAAKTSGSDLRDGKKSIIGIRTQNISRSFAVKDNRRLDSRRMEVERRLIEVKR